MNANLKFLNLAAEVGAAAIKPLPNSRKVAGRAPLSSWQDIDASLAEYCAAKGLAVSEGIEAAIDLHLRAMAEWLDDLEAKASGGPAGEDEKGEGERRE